MKWKDLLSGTEDKHFKYLGIGFILFYFLVFILNIYEGSSQLSLWFCITIVLIFGIGLYYKNLLLLSATVTSSFLINLLLSIDLISYSITGNIIFGMGQYILVLSPLRYAITFYHLFLLVVPVYVILILKKFHNKAWIFSSIHYIVLSIVTLLITKPDAGINFVRRPASIGFFDFVYYLKPGFIPYFIHNWILMTVFVFISIQIVFYLIMKKREKIKS